MDRAVQLGKALRQLRLLRGLSVEACAALVGTTVELMIAAEDGDVEPWLLGDLAKAHHLDMDYLRQGTIWPLETKEEMPRLVEALLVGEGWSALPGAERDRDRAVLRRRGERSGRPSHE